MTVTEPPVTLVQRLIHDATLDDEATVTGYDLHYLHDAAVALARAAQEWVAMQPVLAAARRVRDRHRSGYGDYEAMHLLEHALDAHDEAMEEGE